MLEKGHDIVDRKELWEAKIIYRVEGKLVVLGSERIP